MTRRRRLVEPDPEELALMRLIDEHPFFGSLNIARKLRERGFEANRKRVRALLPLLQHATPASGPGLPNARRLLRWASGSCCMISGAADVEDDQ